MTHRIMVDLETLSSKPNALVASIGAVQFGPEGTGQEFYKVLDMPSQEAMGRHISASTFAWWVQQSEDARKLFKDVSQVEPVVACLEAFGAFCGRVTDSVVDAGGGALLKPPYNVEIWGYGSTFDNVVLRGLYEAAGVKAPWTYRGDLCYRTLVSLAKGLVEVPPRTGTHHNALDDARYQAQCAAIYLKRMGVR